MSVLGYEAALNYKKTRDTTNGIINTNKCNLGKSAILP